MMCRAFTVLGLTVVVIFSFVKSEDDRSKRQINEDRWEWGYVEETKMPEIPKKTVRVLHTHRTESSKTTASPRQITTTTLSPETETEPEYCKYYNPTKPDFSQPGRRISEAKCYEYIWELNVRLERDKRLDLCRQYNMKKYNIRYAIGGFPTGPGDYPHMGALGWKASQGTWVFKCGSSLISKKFVLTAAHCTRASPRDTSIADPVPKIVRLGDKNIIDTKYHDLPPTDVNISRIIVHPQYSPPKKYFDIALIELEKEVKFSRLLQPACLWNSFSTSKLGTEAVLTGWGVVETGSLKISPELQAATVDILDSPLCNDLLKNSCNRNWCRLSEHQICAGKLAGGVDACQGDSGGPLQVKIQLPSKTQGQMHHVFGIISFGIGCAHQNLPGLYTRVSSFIDWIEKVVWPN